VKSNETDNCFILVLILTHEHIVLLYVLSLRNLVKTVAVNGPENNRNSNDNAYFQKYYMFVKDKET